jgi:branched-chain amino acid transport system permease protein
MTAVASLVGRLRLSRGLHFAFPLALLLAVALVPSLGASPNLMRLLIVTFVWSTTSLAWNLLGGLAGQVSFGFAVFYGLGAYATAILTNAHAPVLVAFAAAAGVAVLASLMVGLPTFRLRGPYFAIATIGVSEAVRVVMTNLRLTGGASGYRVVEHVAFDQASHFYSALALVSLAILISVWISRSKLGLALVAIRENEQAAADLGINPLFYKLAIHAVAAALVAVAGGVFARYALFIHPQGVFGFHTGVFILLMPVIGGIGTVWGPVLGGLVVGIVEEQLVALFPQVHLLLYGILLIAIVLVEPGGIVGLLRKLFRKSLAHWSARASPS